MTRQLPDYKQALKLIHPDYHPESASDVRTRHDANDTRNRTHKSKFEIGNFVAIDGEGISTGVELKAGKGIIRQQNYVLLKNSLGEKVVDINGLSTDVCLDFVLNSAKTKSAILVCYGASYDCNMMLRDLPENKLRQLHDGKRVFYKNYILEYKPRKEFNICQFHRQWNKEKRDNDIVVERSVTLWDVLSFFQYSFVTTLKSYFTSKVADMSARERYSIIIPLIEEGKNERTTFTEEQLETFVEPYCEMEVQALVELMGTFRGYLEKAELVLNRWDGAGAVAGAILKKYNVRPYIEESLLPPEVTIIAEYAYFGGRIEVLLFGNYPFLVYHYDINSAYPSAMIDIPSFAGGKWLHSDWGCSPQDVFDAPSVSVFLVDWEYTGELDPIITPFPWRSKDNRVYFPRRGLGWIYKPELEVALKYFRNNFKFNILESWMFEPAVPIVYPYAFIPDVYRLRQEAILNGDGTEKVYKLGLNSLYGKTAQGKGYNKQSKKKPAYHNLVVAGLTTSRTRAKLLEAAMQSPTDIISLATDGIYSKKPLDLPGVDSQKKVLGQWEFKTHEYMTVIMSGVYWLGNTDMEVEDAYSRGYDKKFKDKLGNEVKFKDLRNHLLKAWHEKQPSYPVPSSRFVTIGSAVGLNDFNQHCWWRTIDRDLDLDMEKVAKSFVKDTTTDRSENLVRAYPKHPYKDTSMSIMSAKYTFEWDDDLDGLPTREFLEEMMYSKE